MKIDTYNFRYDPRNLETTNIDLFNSTPSNEILMIIWLFFIIWILIYTLIPYIEWLYLILQENKKKEENRKKIRELILMREVQNELEREIEESMLNEWLKTKTV